MGTRLDDDKWKLHNPVEIKDYLLSGAHILCPGCSIVTEGNHKGLSSPYHRVFRNGPVETGSISIRFPMKCNLGHEFELSLSFYEKGEARLHTRFREGTGRCACPHD